MQCPYCGYEYKDSEIKCPFCGTENTKYKKAKVPSKTAGASLLGILLAILLVVVAVNVGARIFMN